jgi:MFS family permease
MSEPQSPIGHLALSRWTDRAVIGIAVAAFASGFGQFGVVAALGDVAKQLGHAQHGTSISDVMGLSGTELGLGLAIIRLTALASLPIIGLADRYGRRRLLTSTLTMGLLLTVAAAGSPTYWWFVAIFACGRPLLTAVNGLTELMAAEQTNSKSRAAAVALTAAGYGIGAGLIAIIHSLASGALGFRGMFVLAIVPLMCIPFFSRWIVEPDRFVIEGAARSAVRPVLGAVGAEFRLRLIVICSIAFAVSVITGPANSFVFIYAQDVVHQHGWVTALMIGAAGVTGLAGLLVGRWMADHLGRRITGTASMLGLALCGALAYSGSGPALVIGYTLGVLSGSALGPAIGSLLAELFPTSVRASATGWWVAAGVMGAVIGLVAFGAIADAGNQFARAGLLTFMPAAAAGGLFWALPETVGREPEELWGT